MQDYESAADLSGRRRRRGASHLVDRLFVGGCTAAYLILIGSVLAALKFYGG
jgi:hypothetical protein